MSVVQVASGPTSSQGVSSPANLSVNDNKKKLHALMAQKDEIEKEIAELNKYLKEQKDPDKLVDKDGFPRADLDVHAIAISKNRLAMLQTDHKQKMEEIQQQLFALHAAVKSSDTTQGDEPKEASKDAHDSDRKAVNVSSTVENKSNSPLRPFYRVDQVFENSPASTAGLKIGDLLLSFGTIRKENEKPGALAGLVQNSVNTTVPVVVWRNPEGMLNLRLTPHTWSGKGLLGCHITPVK